MSEGRDYKNGTLEVRLRRLEGGLAMACNDDAADLVREARDEIASKEIELNSAAATVVELRSQVEAKLWQPIATAPLDGTHILVGTFPAPAGHITVATAHWFDGRNYGLKSGHGAWALSVNYDGDHSDHGVDAPTHWMPIPTFSSEDGK